MTDYTLIAELLYGEFVEDRRVRRPKRAVRMIADSLRSAFSEGQRSGRMMAEFEVAHAAGLAHGFSCVRGDDLLAAIRRLSEGGRVRLIVEGKEQVPQLRLTP